MTSTWLRSISSSSGLIILLYCIMIDWMELVRYRGMDSDFILLQYLLYCNTSYIFEFVPGTHDFSSIIDYSPSVTLLLHPRWILWIYWYLFFDWFKLLYHIMFLSLLYYSRYSWLKSRVDRDWSFRYWPCRDWVSDTVGRVSSEYCTHCVCFVN